ncbi:MAG: nitroreductase [Clostridiales bacterium]|nr:nitroreductase [Clostridiales bacterium]
MKELFNAVYKRKSMRKYNGGSLTAEELKQVKDYLHQLKPLCSELKVDFEIVPCKQTNCKFDAEYALIVYSEEGNLWLANVGYMLEQWDLYLATMNIGVCWYGMGKVREEQKYGLSYAIMLSFGKSKEEDFRVDTSEFNRKSVSEIWQVVDNANLDLHAVGEIARLAPSACNSQPWKVEQEGNKLKIYREKGKTPVLSSVLFKHWNKVDVGIFLCFLEIALENEGYAFARQLHTDTDDQKKVLTATYTISK